jgi:hypothetical protein
MRSDKGQNPGLRGEVCNVEPEGWHGLTVILLTLRSVGTGRWEVCV